MSEDLRECPFCGGTHSINVINFITGDSFRKCDICGAEAPETKTPEEAAEKWNTRPAEDALKAGNERLKKKLHSVKAALIYNKNLATDTDRWVFDLCDALIKGINAFFISAEKGGEDE